jgi:Flp pilus assembly protein TadG
MAVITKKLGRRRRLGTAVVEMAVVTPLLITMLFGIIEFGYAFTVRQSLVTAAREGARVAALPGSSATDVQARIDSYLNPIGLKAKTTTTLTRATTQAPTEMVKLVIPYSQVSLLGNYFGSTAFNLSATCSMRKEGMD